jgi:glucose/sorbosone dehydrogenase/flagellar hook capping protein FlgD
VNTLPAGGGPQVLRSAITPSNNPLSTPDSNAKLVFAYGFRNPWRMQIDRVTGNLFVADPGEDIAEELDQVPPGANAGWPYREGTHVRTPSCPEPGGVGANTYLAPIVNLDRGPGNTVIQVAGVYRPASAGSANWPSSYAGDLFYGEFYSGFLRRLRLSGGIWVPGPSAPGQPDATNWATGLVSATDFQIGPDGSLWWLEQLDGSLHRIRYNGPIVDPAPRDTNAVALRLTPMPFATTTDISFKLSSPVPVFLTIHDLSGRTVRRLLWSEVPALDGNGNAHFTWDGTRGDGRHLPAGMYFARLQVGGAVHTARLVRIR